MKKNLYLAILNLLVAISFGYSQTFTSAICGSGGFTVTNCVTALNIKYQSVTVTGLPGNLSNEFGLKSVVIDATIPGVFSITQPYIDLIDPNGVQHRLFNPQSFPQYDGTKHQFKVTFSACNSGGIINANDNKPFQVNGVYRPMGDNPLNKVNLSNINPNGEWRLALCTDKDFTLNCFRLEFGPTCATVKTYKIINENCKSFVQITYNEINAPFCDNQDGNSFPDYYIKIAGSNDPITGWHSANHLKIAVPQGKTKLQFGTYFKNSQGIEHYSCPQIFEVDVPAFDTEAPKIQNCPQNVTVTLDADGKKEFILAHPKFTDNCNNLFSSLNINFLGGATDLGGAIQLNNLPTFPDQQIRYAIKGVGQQEFDFLVKDAAGNQASCRTTITALPNPNSCANDTQAPFFPFGQCRRNYVLLVNNPTTVVNFLLRHPIYAENCEKTTDVVTVEYYNGASDKDGNILLGPLTNSMVPGKFFPYSIKGIGSVELKFDVTDKKGNTGSCKTTVTTKLFSACARDVHPPVLSSCMPNSIINLNSQTNSATFRVTTPQMFDNCGIDSTRLVMQYINGAKGLYGETYREFFNVGGGETSELFYMVGVGKVIITVYAYDKSGNVSACSSTITARTNYVDPCASFNPSLTVAGNNCANNVMTVQGATGAVRIDWKNGNQMINTTVINSTPAKDGVRVVGTGVQGTANNQLGAAQNVTLDQAGNMYVCDSENNRVLKYAPGATTGVVVAGGNGAGHGLNQLDIPFAIQVDKEDNLYVVEFNNNRVTKWMPGTNSGIIVAGGNGAGKAANQLDGPFGISVDANGNIYVADFYNYRIQKWVPGAIQGITVAGTGIKGSAANQLSDIRDVVVNDAGEIFVAETDLGRVKKFPANSMQGTNGTIVVKDQEKSLRCMSFDAAGNIYITNIQDHYVKKFPPNGTATTAGVIVAGGNGQGSGSHQLDGPRGVAVDAQGNIYVVDQKNYRVQKWAQTLGALPNVYTPLVAGLYTAEVTRADGCKSTTNNLVINACNTSFQLIIQDGCVQAGDSTHIPVTVKGFTKINALEFTLQVSNTTSLSLQSITNKYFTNIQSNNLSNGNLKVVWDDLNGQEIDLPDGTKLFDIVIKSSSDFNTPASLSGFDPVVVSSKASSVSILSNSFTRCAGTGISPKGLIADVKDKSHPDAKVSLSLAGKNVAEINTGADGRYAFNPVPNTHRITPSDNSNIRKGVNVADVSIIRRYILSLPVALDNYNLVAADVNKDGTINIADVSMLNKVVLEINNEFTNNTSWRFLPKNLDISSNPLKVDWPDYIDMSEPNLDYNSLDFISIKVGDVNGSALSLAENLTTRGANVVSLPDTNLVFKKNMTIPLRYSDTEDLSAFMLKIKYDHTIIKLVKIESSAIPGFGIQHYHEKDGLITIAYDHPQGLFFTPRDVLMNMVFENVSATGVSKLEISDLLFLNKNLSEIPLQSQHGSLNNLASPVLTPAQTATLIAYPNPFQDACMIEVQLHKPDRVQVVLLDITGRLIKQISVPTINKDHKILVDDLPHHGLLHCKIITGEETYTLKLIKF